MGKDYMFSDKVLTQTELVMVKGCGIFGKELT